MRGGEVFFLCVLCVCCVVVGGEVCGVWYACIQIQAAKFMCVYNYCCHIHPPTHTTPSTYTPHIHSPTPPRVLAQSHISNPIGFYSRNERGGQAVNKGGSQCTQLRPQTLCGCVSVCLFVCYTACICTINICTINIYTSNTQPYRPPIICKHHPHHNHSPIN